MGRIISLFWSTIHVKLPDLAFVVWSVLGPVSKLGVYPLCLVQLKSSPIKVLRQPHASMSKLHVATQYIKLYVTSILFWTKLILKMCSKFECRKDIHFETQLRPVAKNATPRPPAGNWICKPSRGSEFNSQRRPWSCIFRNWSRLSLKMYTFTTLEFTTPYFNFHLLTTSVNAKY